MDFTTFLVLAATIYGCFYAFLGMTLAVFSWQGYAMTWSFVWGWRFLGLGLFCEESSGDWIILPLPLVGFRIAFADLIPNLGIPEPWQDYIHAVRNRPKMVRVVDESTHIPPMSCVVERPGYTLLSETEAYGHAVRHYRPTAEVQSELQELLEEIEHHYNQTGNLDMAARYVQDYPHHAAAINEWVDELMAISGPLDGEEWEDLEQSVQALRETHREGDWDGKKCPRCGSGTLANQEGRRWCSFVGGAGIPGCTWGLATDAEGEQFVEGFGLCQPVRVATDPPSSSFQLGQEVQWWESWETWELIPSAPSRAAGIVANLDDRGVLVIPHVTVHPKSALFLHRIFVFPIPDGDNDPPDDKELWYTPERNSRRLNEETPTS